MSAASVYAVLNLHQGRLTDVGHSVMPASKLQSLPLHAGSRLFLQVDYTALLEVGKKEASPDVVTLKLSC